MQSLAFPVVALVLLASLSSAIVAFWVLSHRLQSARPTSRKLLESAEKSLVFLFDDEELIDATDPARALLDTGPAMKSGWPRLVATLSHRFPTLATDLRDLANQGRMTLSAASPDDTAVIKAEWWDEVVRIELYDPRAPDSETPIDRLCLDALQSELSLLRSMAEHAPFLLWQAAEDGRISWANTAYINLANNERAARDQFAWPPPTLFDMSELAKESTHRMSLRPVAGGDIRWFDCRVIRQGDNLLHFAIEADEAVRAESALKDFVATLTKTFANLPIGLAIFDKTRHLALFNPALTDLTSLPVDFLSARPTLHAVLDKLRDKRMIPEQKNYKTWREHLAALEAAATDGTYEEIWALASGRTYRITGRPHPNGAVAFQFEDITSEIALTRRFRSELELGQALVDSLPEAIAVFSRNGSLTMSNDAYVALWGMDPGTTIGEVSSTDAVRHWTDACMPSPVWDRIEHFIHQTRNRTEWRATLALRDGRMLDVRLAPLSGGATLVGFTAHPIEATNPDASTVKSERA